MELFQFLKKDLQYKTASDCSWDGQEFLLLLGNLKIH